MALNKPSSKKPNVQNAGAAYSRSAQRAQESGTGLAGTFRTDEDAPRPAKLRKSTFDFDPVVFQALKVHAAQQDKPMRALLDRYVRDGLERDGAEVPGTLDGGQP